MRASVALEDVFKVADSIIFGPAEKVKSLVGSRRQLSKSELELIAVRKYNHYIRLPQVFSRPYPAALSKEEKVSRLIDFYSSRPCYKLDGNDDAYLFSGGGEYQYGHSNGLQVFSSVENWSTWFDFLSSKKFEERVRSDAKQRTEFYIYKSSDYEFDRMSNAKLILYGSSRHYMRDGRGYNFTGSADLLYKTRLPIFFHAGNYSQFI